MQCLSFVFCVGAASSYVLKNVSKCFFKIRKDQVELKFHFEQLSILALAHNSFFRCVWKIDLRQANSLQLHSVFFGGRMVVRCLLTRSWHSNSCFEYIKRKLMAQNVYVGDFFLLWRWWLAIMFKMMSWMNVLDFWQASWTSDQRYRQISIEAGQLIMFRF